MELHNGRLDFLNELVKGSVVRFWTNSDNDVSTYAHWKQMHAQDFTQTAFDLIPLHSVFLEARHHQTDSASGQSAGYLRERGSRRPNLEMSGPDALPLSRNTL